MKAKRGDLIVVRYVKEYDKDKPIYEIELVAGVGRDGEVQKTVRYSFASEHTEPLYRNSTSRGHAVRRYRTYYDHQTWIVEKDKVDVVAAFAACKGRPDATHEWAPMEFDGLEGVRDFLAPYRTEVS